MGVWVGVGVCGVLQEKRRLNGELELRAGGEATGGSLPAGVLG